MFSLPLLLFAPGLCNSSSVNCDEGLYLSSCWRKENADLTLTVQRGRSLLPKRTDVSVAPERARNVIVEQKCPWWQISKTFLVFFFFLVVGCFGVRGKIKCSLYHETSTAVVYDWLIRHLFSLKRHPLELCTSTVPHKTIHDSSCWERRLACK